MVDKKLQDLICGRELEFYASGKKLDVLFSPRGRYPEYDFAKSVSRLARESVVVRGKCLDDFLVKSDNVYVFVDFLLGILVSTRFGTKVHVDVDVCKLGGKYEGKRACELMNYLGQSMINATCWMSKQSVFERDWNIALCFAWQGFVGIPGYEWPRTARQFVEHCAYHATGIMIGSKAQLSCYELLAEKFPGYSDEIHKMLYLFR